MNGLFTNESLATRGLSLNLRSINSILTRLFQRYQLSLQKITGGEIFGKDQTREIQKDSISVEYVKGQLLFKNDIDKLQFLIDNRDRVSKSIGISSKSIYSNRRNLKEVVEYISKLDNAFELGDMDKTMQMYISRHDDNVEQLDSQQDWVDYILTQDWITKLAESSSNSQESSSGEQLSFDYRIDYLADTIQSMMQDHEVDYHKSLDDFKANNFLDDGQVNRTSNARNKMNSFKKLDYGFYEIFKPIGASSERHIKLKMSTNGDMELFGVIDLDDCTEIPWEYGSMDYLRSLNTGNRKYEFKISIPFTDENSIIWWKPKNRERIADAPWGDSRYRYYKPYDKERCLRWFGTTYVPVMDLDTITKKQVSSAPNSSEKPQLLQKILFSDATQLIDQNATARQTTSSNKRLLSLCQKSTIDLVQKDDGQYIQFILNPENNNKRLQFSISGKILPVIQEMNHFESTWNAMKTIYMLIQKWMVFLDITRSVNPTIEEIWGLAYPELQYIPDEWLSIQEYIENILPPTTIDLIRLRNVDYSQMMYDLLTNAMIRVGFIQNIHLLSDADFTPAKAKERFIASQLEIPFVFNQVKKKLNKQDFYDVNLEQYIMKYDSASKEELETWYSKMNVTEGKKQELELIMDSICQKYPSTYDINYDNVTVDNLRESIQVFNNLLVGLPVDTEQNRITSRNIFRDWKKFVDGATRHLVENEQLYVVYEGHPEDSPTLDYSDELNWKKETGVGTDGKTYTYVEFYTDVIRKTPLVDYSYCFDENGNVLYDRFDYWTEEDFR